MSQMRVVHIMSESEDENSNLPAQDDESQSAIRNDSEQMDVGETEGEHGEAEGVGNHEQNYIGNRAPGVEGDQGPGGSGSQGGNQAS